MIKRETQTKVIYFSIGVIELSILTDLQKLQLKNEPI